MRSVDELIAEGDAVPVAGWDFSWFAGRATEERPPWGYVRVLGARIAALRDAVDARLEDGGAPGAAMLDLQTGGGEVLVRALELAGVPGPPVGPAIRATESWPPNLEVARRNLAAYMAGSTGGAAAAEHGAEVVECGVDDDLPFGDASFDLVSSRHPVSTRWDEIARVLRPGGSYLSQEVGDRSVVELSEYMLGPQHTEGRAPRDPRSAVEAATAAGLDVVDLQVFKGQMEFLDVAAVVYFLRKVIWIVPGFTVDAYRDRLRDLQARIESHGPFRATTSRFLIEGRKR